MNERLEKQKKFILEIDKEKNIFRQTHLTGYKRQENDAEHSWHMALMACLLSEYANEEVDLLHVLQMILVHDLVEIDAGDTYAYDDAGNATKREREKRPPTGSFPSCRKIRRKRCGISGRSLRRKRRRSRCSPT